MTLSLNKTLFRALRCQRGNIIIFAAIMAFVLLGAVGVAIDMSRAQILKSRMQAALDASNLATGVAYLNNCKTASNQQTCLTAVAQNYFNANFPSKYLSSQPITVTPDLSQLSQGHINLTASTQQKTSVISIMGVKTVNVSAVSQVTVPVGGSSAPGACGPDDTLGIATSTTPDPTKLCASGVFSNPVATSSGWTWTCTGSTQVNCSEPLQAQCGSSVFSCSAGTLNISSERGNSAAWGTNPSGGYGASWTCQGSSAAYNTYCCNSGQNLCTPPVQTGTSQYATCPYGTTSNNAANVIQPLSPAFNCVTQTKCTVVPKNSVITPCVSPQVAGPDGPPTTSYSCSCPSSGYGSETCVPTNTGSCLTPCVAPASSQVGSNCITWECPSQYGSPQEYINGVAVGGSTSGGGVADAPVAPVFSDR